LLDSVSVSVCLSVAQLVPYRQRLCYACSVASQVAYRLVCLSVCLLFFAVEMRGRTVPKNQWESHMYDIHMDAM